MHVHVEDSVVYKAEKPPEPGLRLGVSPSCLLRRAHHWQDGGQDVKGILVLEVSSPMIHLKRV